VATCRSQSPRQRRLDRLSTPSKELIARTVHHRSPRHDQTFVAFNAAGRQLTEGARTQQVGAADPTLVFGILS
jgi:hypothetical protein